MAAPRVRPLFVGIMEQAAREHGEAARALQRPQAQGVSAMPSLAGGSIAGGVMVGGAANVPGAAPRASAPTEDGTGGTRGFFSLFWSTISTGFGSGCGNLGTGGFLLIARIL